MNEYIKKLKNWWYANRPCMCGVCRAVKRRADMRYERTTTGVGAPLCVECWKVIFTPFAQECE